MSQNTKDWVQVAAWGITIIAGIVAAWKAIIEMKRSNDQRWEDMRWKQAEMAKKCLDEFTANDLARAALKMLDWTGRYYTKPDGGKTKPVDHQIRRNALRTTNTVFLQGKEDDADFIRDAFDELFDHFERAEHFIRIKLILFDDIQQPLSYHISKLAGKDDREIYQKYLQEYGFQLAQDFLKRFPVWNAT